MMDIMNQLTHLLLIVSVFSVVDPAALSDASHDHGSCAIDGKVWKINECKECRCWRGKIWCDVITCTVFDDVGCSNYVKDPKKCCHYICLDDVSKVDTESVTLDIE